MGVVLWPRLIIEQFPSLHLEWNSLKKREEHFQQLGQSPQWRGAGADVCTDLLLLMSFVSSSNPCSTPSQTAWDHGSSCTVGSCTRPRAARSCMDSFSMTSCCSPTWLNSLCLPDPINCSALNLTPSSKCTKWWVSQGAPSVGTVGPGFWWGMLLSTAISCVAPFAVTWAHSGKQLAQMTLA